MKKSPTFWFTSSLVCSSFLVSQSYAAPTRKGAYTPKAGSSERKAIMDALRIPIQKEAKEKVVFYDVYLKVDTDWAYVWAMSRNSKGGYLKKYGSAGFDPGTYGLVRKNGKSWKVLYWGIASDASPLEEMRKMYPKAPKSIFPKD